jgi:hypothetical protein
MRAHSGYSNPFKCLVFAGITLAVLVAVTGPRAVIAQSLTLSFRFDDGSANPAVNFPSLATVKNITATDSGKTFTIDVFATVTGTGGTAEQNLGLQSVFFRGVSSSVSNGAFSTGAGIGVQGQAAGYFDTANPPFSNGGAGPWGFFNASNTANGTGWTAGGSGTIGEFGSTTNGTTASATADGIADFGGASSATSYTALA